MTTLPATVNGAPRPDTHGRRLDALVGDLLPASVVDGTPRGVAVALNETVVPHGAWPSTVVNPGDRLEIVTAVQGG